MLGPYLLYGAASSSGSPALPAHTCPGHPPPLGRSAPCLCCPPPLVLCGGHRTGSLAVQGSGCLWDTFVSLLSHPKHAPPPLVTPGGERAGDWAVGPALCLPLLPTRGEVKCVRRAVLGGELLHCWPAQAVAQGPSGLFPNSSCRASGLVRGLLICNESMTSSPLPFSLYNSLEPKIKLFLKVTTGNLRGWQLQHGRSTPGAHPTHN